MLTLYPREASRYAKAVQRRQQRLCVPWLERHFHIEDVRDLNTGEDLGAGPIRLMEHQRRIITEATRQDSAGRFVYQTVVYSAPKKSGKTRIAAGVAAWLADMSSPFSEIYFAANDGKQSTDRLLSAVAKALTYNKELGWRATKSQVVLPNGTYMRAIPVDPTGEAGGNPRGMFFSELWGYRLEHKKRLWTEMTMSPVMMGRSIRWVDSYAGYKGESETLENLYNQGVLEGRRHPDFPDLPVYTNARGRLFVYWDHEHRMPWQTDAYYADEATTLPSLEFRRIHGNEWVTSVDTFVPLDWWTANLWPGGLPPLVGKEEKLVLGVDAAVSGACFAIVGVTRWGPTREDVAVRYCRIWEPPPGGKIDFEEPENEVKRLADLHRVVEVAYDPYELHRSATEQRRQRVANWKDFGQQSPRLRADTQLYQLIRDGRVAHSGEPDLQQHILNANQKVSKEEENKLRIIIGRGPVDAAVALSMAVDRCLALRT